MMSTNLEDSPQKSILLEKLSNDRQPTGEYETFPEDQALRMVGMKNACWRIPDRPISPPYYPNRSHLFYQRIDSPACDRCLQEEYAECEQCRSLNNLHFLYKLMACRSYQVDNFMNSQYEYYKVLGGEPASWLRTTEVILQRGYGDFELKPHPKGWDELMRGWKSELITIALEWIIKQKSLLAIQQTATQSGNKPGKKRDTALKIQVLLVHYLVQANYFPTKKDYKFNSDKKLHYLYSLLLNSNPQSIKENSLPPESSEFTKAHLQAVCDQFVYLGLLDAARLVENDLVNKK